MFKIYIGFFHLVQELWFENLICINFNECDSITNLYIYIYISKSWSVAFIVATLQLRHISVHIIIFYLFNFPIIVFNIYLFLIFKLLQPFSLPYLFISPLNSTLISFILFPFTFLYFCLFLFTPSNYKFVTISSILHIAIPHKNMLFLSLSLSQFFGGFFIFLTSLL